jgi:hypothetical protein
MKASIKFSVVEDNGDPFYDAVVDYSNLTRMDVVELETHLMTAMGGLLEVGKKKAADKMQNQHPGKKPGTL